ncbi:MAG: type II secretion system GspH family protein [Oscillospiraceae bacterium]|nr:type II secretion system GspH family protein [Oscillospiraceae bacterium]
MKRIGSKSGFTLVECLIAITVFALMSILVAGLINSALIKHRSNMEQTRNLKVQKDNLLRNNTEDRPDQLGGLVTFDFGDNISFGAETWVDKTVTYEFNVKISPEGSDGLQLSKMQIAGIVNPGNEIPQMWISFTNKETRRAYASVILQSPAFTFTGMTSPPAVNPTTVKGTVYSTFPEAFNTANIAGCEGLDPGTPHEIPGINDFNEPTVFYTVQNGVPIYATSIRVIVERDARPIRHQEETIELNIFNFPENFGGSVIGILPGGGMETFLELDPNILISPQKGNPYRRIIIKKPAGVTTFEDYNFIVFTTHEVKNVNEWLRMNDPNAVE